MNSIERRVSSWRWLGLSALVVLADQTSKAYIARHFGEFEVTRVLPILEITRMQNVGAAFSLLASASGWQRWFFIALALGVSLAIVNWLVRPRANPGVLLPAGLACILGGAVGNLIDRVRLGSVIDFIHFHWHQAYFPAFNLADTSITIGAGLLLLDALFDARRNR
ncbi:MAG: lipoprotein signal peptidase [Gammaproteobacteria bacterium]|nr:lipoprotein signal peptidase [Gammaproteobacteria bacterium]